MAVQLRRNTQAGGNSSVEGGEPALEDGERYIKKATVDSIGQRNTFVKTLGNGGSMNEAYVYGARERVYLRYMEGGYWIQQDRHDAGIKTRVSDHSETLLTNLPKSDCIGLSAKRDFHSRGVSSPTHEAG